MLKHVGKNSGDIFIMHVTVSVKENFSGSTVSVHVGY